MSAAQMGACAMANQSRKKGGKRAFGKTLIRLFFVLMLLSMLAAYISNQVTISSKRAELETLNEQIAQQQTENQEMQRILSTSCSFCICDAFNTSAMSLMMS